MPAFTTAALIGIGLAGGFTASKALAGKKKTDQPATAPGPSPTAAVPPPPTPAAEAASQATAAAAGAAKKQRHKAMGANLTTLAPSRQASATAVTTPRTLLGL
jgi:hypothetical protein